MTEFSDIPEQPYDWQHVPKYRGGNRVTRNKLDPVAMKMPRVRAASGARPSTNPDKGYWNLVVGAMFLLFLLYVIAHNELQTWANILFWKPSAPVQVGSPITPTGAGSALGGNAAGGAAPAGVTALTPQGTPQLPGALMWPSNILNNGVDGIINQLNRASSGILGGVTGVPPGAPGPSAASTAAASGGILGNNFWQGPVGSMLQRFGIGK
jgi:uncharacterized integral membrane protein